MSKALATKNLAAVLLGLALVFGFAFAFATPAKADTLSDLQAQVQALLAQIAALQGSASTSMSASCHTFTQNLKSGSSGGEVKWVQQFLNGHGATVSASGAGSAGNETSTFGPKTKAAVIVFQNANKADILTPVGLTAGTGTWGPSSRAKANALCAGSTTTTSGTTTGGTTTTTAGGNLVVAAGAQPANTLAVASATRVPFTVFTLTNTSGAAVKVNSVTVQRTGLGVDANFSGLVLLDQNGIQIGIAKTLNSNHQATVGDSGFTIGAGQTATFTVAGNMAAAATVQTGQVVSLQVVGINTSATVGGSLPITGAQQTINSTLTIGSVSTSTSSFDPGAAQTKLIGDTSVRVSGVRFTAGSAEDIKLSSVRWRQTGTVSASDLSNVVTIVNGTSYPTTLDASGSYYTTVFPGGGLLIAKGNSIDIYTQVDITGSGSALRTIELDIDKSTDLYFVGQLYGYGIAPSGTYSQWYKGYVTTINAGTATTIQNATTVASQNVPINVSNTPLGGFVTTFQGEPVSENSIVVRFNYGTATASSNLLTSVSLVDQNGVTVAGPVDAVNVIGRQQKATFTDTIVFPVGTRTYTLKGKIPSGVGNGDTITASTTPSSDWAAGTGQVSGNSITMPSAQVTMNQMTIQSATATIAIAASPASTTIVAGVTNALLANVQIDATQSGEDIRLSSLPLELTGSASTTGTAFNSGAVSGCQLYNGATSLTTGANVQNPTSATKFTFTFDNVLTVLKGTVATIGVQCNIGSSVQGWLAWGVTGADFSSGSIVGVQSGASATPAVTKSAGNQQTIVASATLTVTVDTGSSPAFTQVAAGTSNVVGSVVKLHATNGAISLTTLRVQLANSTCPPNPTADGLTSNSCSGDVTSFSVYDGTSPVGTGSFIGGATTASSTISGVTVPANGDKLLTVKVSTASIGVGQPAGVGDIVKLDPLTAQGTSAGSTINAAATAGASGFELFKSFPSIANPVNVSCTNTNSCNGTAQVLKKFTISANAAGPVGINTVAVSLATSSASVTNLKLYAYTDSGYSNPANVPTAGEVTATTGGQFGSTCACGSAVDIAAPTVTFYQPTPLQVAAGGTLYFALKGDVTLASGATTWSVNATVLGDTATSSMTNYNATTTSGRPFIVNSGVSTSTAGSPANFVWSDNASTTAATTTNDWFTGYFVSGLPSGGF